MHSADSRLPAIRLHLYRLFFFLILAADLIMVITRQENIRLVTKPLIIISLLVYAFKSMQFLPSALKKYLFAALLFSWLGDMLLMFENRQAIFFILGLVAFLIAHLFYIILFHSIKKEERMKSRWLLIIPVALYYAWLISLLSPHLGDMKLPVRIYGMAISFMLLLALHLPFGIYKKPGMMMAAGAVLFVISDSILAINKFYQPLPQAGFLIMLTYGMAQYFLTEGFIARMRLAKSI